jgi:hypothetical protein
VRGSGVIATSQQAVMANAVTAGIAAYPISGAVAIRAPSATSLGGSTTAATIDSSHGRHAAERHGQHLTAIAVDAASHSYAGSYVVGRRDRRHRPPAGANAQTTADGAQSPAPR